MHLLVKRGLVLNPRLPSPQASKKCTDCLAKKKKKKKCGAFSSARLLKSAGNMHSFEELIKSDIQYTDRPFDSAGAIWQVRIQWQTRSNTSDCWCCPRVTTKCNHCQSPTAVVNEEEGEKNKKQRRDMRSLWLDTHCVYWMGPITWFTSNILLHSS